MKRAYWEVLQSIMKRLILTLPLVALPGIAYADLTRQDLKEISNIVREETKGIGETKARVDSLRKEVGGEIKSLRSEISSMRDEISAYRWIIATAIIVLLVRWLLRRPRTIGPSQSEDKKEAEGPAGKSPPDPSDPERMESEG
jgi:hypothetical protein